MTALSKLPERCLSYTVLGVYLVFFAVSAAFGDTYKVSNIAEFKAISGRLLAGDTIVLANGEWKDFEIEFRGNGAEDSPITLRAESAGGVILTGQSNLQLFGQHLLVQDLVFKNGFTPTGSVISFGSSQEPQTFYSRVTNVVIDRYSNPVRSETDYWVTMYGRHNRFDHNSLMGKSNRGVTLAVRLNTVDSRENYHRIDHNYFGPRPTLGSNGGETLRVGTSHHSLHDSYTLIENNVFDRCDGELEIISIKSGKNVIKGNLFYESRGTLTLRHGNSNTITGNVFIGNQIEHTGGIRVINADQEVTNNYLEGISGYRFGGALVVMNGVPDSPINRYHRVENARISNNTLINTNAVQLAAGSDSERSAVPVGTQISRNLFYSDSDAELFTVYDDISGIEFKDNLQSFASPFAKQHKFLIQPLVLERGPNGLLYPVNTDLSVGVSRDLSVMSLDRVGADWYPKPPRTSTFDTGNRKVLQPAVNAISEALQETQAGDVLVLRPGRYIESKTIAVDHPVTIESSKGSDSLEIIFERGTLFDIRTDGALKLKGLSISGRSAPDAAGNSLIRSQRAPMEGNFSLVIEDSLFSDFDINHSFSIFTASKSTFADEVSIQRSKFSNVSGSILQLDAETDDLGVYNAEYVNILDSEFESVGGSVLSLYRGGTDESTFGPHLTFSGNTLLNVGNSSKNRSSAAMLIHGVQRTLFVDNTVLGSNAISINHTVGDPRTRIGSNRFGSQSFPVVSELNSTLVNTVIFENNTTVDME